jgi:ankyrin repeat protein
VSTDSPLYGAIEHDDPEHLRQLLASGVEPRYVDFPSGWSPLHHAVDCEGDYRNQASLEADLRLVRPLLDAGADVNATTDDARTPLDVAYGYEHQLAIDALRAAGGKRGGELGPRIR